LVFTCNLRIGRLERAGKPTPENSHKRGNHPLRLPFREQEMALLASLGLDSDMLAGGMAG
jgi:hypothetical protein